MHFRPGHDRGCGLMSTSGIAPATGRYTAVENARNHGTTSGRDASSSRHRKSVTTATKSSSREYAAATGTNYSFRRPISGLSRESHTGYPSSIKDGKHSKSKADSQSRHRSSGEHRKSSSRRPTSGLEPETEREFQSKGHTSRQREMNTRPSTAASDTESRSRPDTSGSARFRRSASGLGRTFYDVVGVIGADSSRSSIMMANVLTLFQVLTGVFVLSNPPPQEQKKNNNKTFRRMEC